MLHCCSCSLTGIHRTGQRLKVPFGFEPVSFQFFTKTISYDTHCILQNKRRRIPVKDFNDQSTMSYIRRIVRTNDNTAATLPPISPEPYYPSLDNVLETRDILRNKVRHEQGVPDEIVDLIIDEAEYWPSVEVGLEERIRIGKDGDRPVVETLPLCYDEEVSDALLFHVGITRLLKYHNLFV